jgi:hypothetical protein
MASASSPDPNLQLIGTFLRRVNRGKSHSGRSRLYGVWSDTFQSRAWSAPYSGQCCPQWNFWCYSPVNVFETRAFLYTVHICSVISEGCQPSAQRNWMKVRCSWLDGFCNELWSFNCNIVLVWSNAAVLSCDLWSAAGVVHTAAVTCDWSCLLAAPGTNLIWIIP